MKVNRNIIGIESQGDPGSRLKVSLDIFVKMDCDIILCVTRTKESTVDFVKELEPEYKINWIKKQDFSNDYEQKNKELASTIISKLLK